MRHVYRPRQVAADLRRLQGWTLTLGRRPVVVVGADDRVVTTTARAAGASSGRVAARRRGRAFGGGAGATGRSPAHAGVGIGRGTVRSPDARIGRCPAVGSSTRGRRGTAATAGWGAVGDRAIGSVRCHVVGSNRTSAWIFFAAAS